jgi:hypothetical protein
VRSAGTTSRVRLLALVAMAGAALALLLWTGTVFTAPDTAVQWSVVSSGGSIGSSTNFRLASTFGQSSAIGVSQSANYRLGAGYWFGAPLDTDGDSVPDPADNCPNWSNTAQALPTWPVPIGDADCDGFPDTIDASGKARETYVGTDPVKHCAATGTPNDESGPDAMPPDFNDDRIINGQDSGKFGGPFGSYNKQVSQGPFGPAGNQLPGDRFDWNGNGIINGQDTGKFQAYFNKTCA